MTRDSDLRKALHNKHFKRHRRVSITGTLPESLGTPQKSLLSYRRKVKASGTEQNDAQLLAVAKQLWKLRWSLLKKPANLSGEEKQAMAALEREDAGFVHRFRSIIRQLGNLFDYSHSEAQAKLKLKQLRQEINAVDDNHLHKILTFFDDHWDQALRYLRKKGMGSTSVGQTPSRDAFAAQTGEKP